MNNEVDEPHIVLFFSEENSFTIVPENTCTNVNDLTAQIKYNGK